MIISKLKLFNWKNFHSCEVNIQNRCFIVGANAAGKSNFLDVFRFLRDIVKQGGGFQSAVSARGGVTSIRSLSAHAQTNISIYAEFSKKGETTPKWSYLLDFKHRSGGIDKSQAVIIKEQVYSFAEQKYLVDRGEGDSDEDAESLLYTYLEQSVANKSFREIRDALNSIEYLNVIPELVRHDSRLSSPEDYYGRNLLYRMSLLNEQTIKAYMLKINEVMKYVVPQLHHIQFEKDKNGMPHLVARYKHWRANGAKQDESSFSDGTLRMIGFLFAMLDGNGTILLEEPEINLHSKVVAQMPEFIAKIQRTRKRQVILTTHSYDILSNEGIRGTEVLYLKNEKDGTKIVNLDSLEDMMRLLRAGLTVADATLNSCSPEDVERINEQ